MDGETFSTAHRSQTVYRGPVVYSDDPYPRLERASSDLELLLLLVFLKSAAHRGQREYRFAVWLEEEPAEDRVDLAVSPALLDAMQRPPQESAGSGFVPARAQESSAVEEADDGGSSRAGWRDEALPTLLSSGNPTVAPRRHGVDRLPSGLRETATTDAAIDALRAAVASTAAGIRTPAAAAAWQAEPVVRFLCSTFGDRIADVGVSEDNFIVIAAEFPATN